MNNTTKYTYTRKHKLTGKKEDVSDDIQTLLNASDYAVVTIPKLTKLICEIHEQLSADVTDAEKVVGISMSFKMFEADVDNVLVEG